MAAGVAIMVASLIGCSDGVQDPGDRLDFDFSDGAEGWDARFADYHQGREADYGLTSGHRELPPPLAHLSGMFLSGNNHSDDLFMFLTRRLDGLAPNTAYRLSFAVELATNAPSGCAGVGGAPGESVYLKVGASAEEPATLADEEGILRLNVDKGDQGSGGAEAAVIGDVAGTVPCEQDAGVYELKRLESAEPISVTSDADGAVWLLVGTDSGFEGVTSLYYTRITVNILR